MPKYPIDVGYVVRKEVALAYSLIIPLLFAFSGIFILSTIENIDVNPLVYLCLFVIGVFGALVGCLWSAYIIVESMRTTWTKDRILEHTRTGMKKPMYRNFYWAYGIASVLGFIIAIAMNDDKYIDSVSGMVILVGVLMWAHLKYIAKK